MKILFTFFFFIMLSSFSALAQDFISSTQDFSTLNVSELTDEQIEKIKLELLSRNVKFNDLKSYLNSKGMTEKQFEDLSLRLQPLKDEDDLDKNLKETNKLKPEINKQKITNKQRVFKDSLVFGHEIFNNSEFKYV